MTQNNFTIVTKISDGPSAVVYKAIQNKLGRPVLLKSMHAHLLQDADSLERFQREAKACALLHSDHIVQVYDVVEYEGSPAIVMEFVDGQSLAQVLAEKRTLPEEFVVLIARDVLAALSYAHGRGVVHRDIKPSNILVAENGTIKLTDFGIASVATASSLTMEGNLMGTPAYMSPEQMRGKGADQRSDLFSLGVTLAELVTGEKLFDGASFAECFNKITSFDGRLPDGVAANVSARFKEFLERLIAADIDERFATSSDAVEFLEGGREPRGATLLSRSSFGKKKRGVLAGAVVVILVFFAAFYFTRKPSPDLAKDAFPASRDLAPDSSQSIVETNGERQPDGHGEKNINAKRHIVSTLELSKGSSPIAKLESKTAAIPPSSSADDSGFVSISCLPWGKVFIDDRYIETTPIAGLIKVKPGKRTVTFTNPDFVPITRQVEVRSHIQISVEANFLETAGFVVVNAVPWADVYIDDQFRDTTPLSHPLVVSSGTRKLSLRNPGYDELTQSIAVSSKDTLRLEFALKQASRH